MKYLNPTSYCLVCGDVRKASLLTSDAKRIASALRQNIPEGLERRYSEAARRMHYKACDTHPFRPMCGSCPKTDMASLREAETEVQTMVYALYLMVRDGSISSAEVRSLLPLLAGHYPIYYKVLERETGQAKEMLGW